MARGKHGYLKAAYDAYLKDRWGRCRSRLPKYHFFPSEPVHSIVRLLKTANTKRCLHLLQDQQLCVKVQDLAFHRVGLDRHRIR